MKTEKINNIQSTTVYTSYQDEYLKQALSNLGQRIGSKGDSISIGSFAATDFITSDVTDFLCIQYDPVTSKFYFIPDSENQQNSEYEFTYTNKLEGVSFILTDGNKFTDAKIVVDSENKYFSIGKIQDSSDEFVEIIATEFNIDNSISEEISIKSDNGTYEILYKNSDTYEKHMIMNYNSDIETLYSEIYVLNSIKEIFDNFETTLINIEDSESAYLNRIYKILSKYIIENYNNIQYINDGFKGLKEAIIAKTILLAYSKHKNPYNGNELFNTYWNKSMSMSFYINDSNELPYNTVNEYAIQTVPNSETIDIPDFVLFSINSYKETNSNTYEKFTINITYYDNSIVDDINIRYTDILPYIGIDSTGTKNVWYINGIESNILAAGKDAGNPNIMMLAYTMIYGNSDIGSNENSITVSLLHSYQDNIINYETILNSIDSSVTEEFYYMLDNTPVNNYESLYKFEISLPDIKKLLENKGYERIITNSILMTFVDIGISENKVDGLTLHEKIHGLNSEAITYITVFWHPEYDDALNQYIWKPILNPAYSKTESDLNVLDGPVLDLSAMMGSKDMISYYVSEKNNPDNYLHRFIVFEHSDNELKNTPISAEETKSKYYPIIKNDNRQYYLNESENTKNDMHFVIKYIPSENISINPSDKSIFVNDNIIDKKHFTIKSKKFSNVIEDTNGNYIPDSDQDNSYPMLDLKEMFTTNPVVLNNLSLVNIDSDGNIYSSKIGVGPEKNALYINGSNKIDNFISNNTLTNDVTTNKTNKIVLDSDSVEHTGLSMIKTLDKYSFDITINISDESISEFIEPLEAVSTKYVTYNYDRFDLEGYLISKFKDVFKENSEHMKIDIYKYDLTKDYKSFNIVVGKDENNKYIIENISEY